MKILVISENSKEITTMQQVLAQGDHKVTFVEETEKAWKLIADNEFRFVIADASEQEQSVHKLVQKIRSDPNITGHIYVLVLLNQGQSEDFVPNTGTGADDYLSKPISPRNLKTRVSVGVRILSMSDTLSQAHEQLENLAMYDNLTGLMNRQAFYKVSRGELDRARRDSQGTSVIAIEIDNINAINDEHGHIIGDEVLQIVAHIIREKCRPYDCIGRWGGAQFAMTLPGFVSTDAEKIVNRILSGVQAKEISLESGDTLEISLNFGIASSQKIDANAEIDPFIQSAILAMNNSKLNDKDNMSVVFI